MRRGWWRRTSRVIVSQDAMEVSMRWFVTGAVSGSGLVTKAGGVRSRFAMSLCLLGLLVGAQASLSAQALQLRATQRYLNVPIGRQAESRVFTISEHGAVKREFPLQLAGDAVDYWVYLDISEFKGQTITLTGPAGQPALDRIYQANRIHDTAVLYKEANRPQFHFTVKRGWSNDVNGPIFYHGQYHLFWQDYPFGVMWDTGFMYWGLAVVRIFTGGPWECCRVRQGCTGAGVHRV